MSAVGYVRRSASEESAVTREAQLATIARLAAERGDTIARVFVDWGKSGGSETRSAYLEMLDSIEAGQISAVYAYDQDRLARSMWLFAGLLRLADRLGFAIVTPNGDLADERNRDGAEYRAVADGQELRKIKRRNRAISEMQTRRGDARGQAPYGHTFRTPGRDGTDRVVHERTDDAAIAHVVDVFKAAGTFLGAARALNAEGWPSRHGRAWHATTVKDLILREAPELAAGVTRGRRREHRPRLLAGILRCRCGGPMSPGTGGGADGYYCGRAQRGLHSRPAYVAEAKLLPLIRAEADRLHEPDAAIFPDAYDDRPDRAALEALRGRVSDAVIAAGLAELDAKRAEHVDAAERLEQVPVRIDFEAWTTQEINAALRTVWESIELGPDMLPAEYVSKLPAEFWD